MGKIEKVRKLTKLHETQEKKVEIQEEQKEVLIDTKGEQIRVNGVVFAGKVMVPKEYSTTVKRILQARLDQRKKEKEYFEHPDRRAIISGKWK